MNLSVMQPLLVGAKREGAIKALPRGVYIEGGGIGWYGNDTMDVWVSAFMERERERINNSTAWSISRHRP